MTDLISRADAIEAVASADETNGTVKVFSGFEVIDILKELPSAEAEWIHCSDRLPNESGEYLATIPLDADETYTEVLTFHKGRFYEDDDEWGATYHDDVLAWMPLPKPYREESEVEE